MNDKKLGLFLITYNRARLLARTLDFLAASVLKYHHIVVLDNASTDDTVATTISKQDSLPNLQIRSNQVNVGPNANFLKAFDYNDFDYTWVICDDDILDLTYFNDVLAVIEQGKIELIHVGAHKQDTWILGGLYKTPQELLSAGYAYFKFASFMPCNIFKTKVFVEKYLVPGYNNIGNAYPHMPFIFGAYLDSIQVYISKRQIAFAQDGQSYSHNSWFIWWMKTCELLVEPSKVRMAYLNQWRDNNITDDELGYKAAIYAQRIMPDSEYLKEFIRKYFTFKDKVKLFRLKINAFKLKNEVHWFLHKSKKKLLNYF